ALHEGPGRRHPVGVQALLEIGPFVTGQTRDRVRDDGHHAATSRDRRYHSSVSRTPSANDTRGSKPVSDRSREMSGRRRATEPGGAGRESSRGVKPAALKTSSRSAATVVSSRSLPTLTTRSEEHTSELQSQLNL